MAEKVRIYQLAKDLNLDTKDMLAMLDDIGVQYKSHASSLEGDVADTIRQLVAQEAAGGAGGAPAQSEPAAVAEPTTATATAAYDTLLASRGMAA